MGDLMSALRPLLLRSPFDRLRVNGFVLVIDLFPVCGEPFGIAQGRLVEP